MSGDTSDAAAALAEDADSAGPTRRGQHPPADRGGPSTAGGLGG